MEEDYMSESSWAKLGLDDRIISATKKLNWQRPTLVQETAIPLSMAGKDVLVKAKTGSGKTGAYLIPLIQRILVDKEVCFRINVVVSINFQTNYTKGVKALILVPTAELAEQIETILKGLCYYCSHAITSLTTTSDKPAFTQVPRLKELPDILIATPGRLLGTTAPLV
jgi:ATP-dependent RNA helicase DDX56/DBP9